MMKKKKTYMKLKRIKNRATVFRTENRFVIRNLFCISMGMLLVFGGVLGIQNYTIKDRVMNIGGSEQQTISESSIQSVDTIGMYTRETIETEIANKDVKEITEGAGGLVVDAKSAILIDVGSGTVLFSQNPREKLPPASVTKVMTMLLVMEALERGQVSLSDTITVSERAASMGGSQMYMEPGETHSLEEMMKGISMVSANDACVAVAEHLCGTVEIFVENMNKRAKELRLEDTHFVNTNGLPVPNHYSSALDIAKISEKLIKYEKTHEWFTNWQDVLIVGLPGKQKEFGLTNTNRLVKQYKGATGIKTGFTQEAGYCLSGSATRDGMTLVAVVLGSPTSKIRFAEVAKLLDYGFATYDNVIIAQKGEINGLVKVNKGEVEGVNAIAKDNISVLVKKGEKNSITVKTEEPEKIQAPVKKGDVLGEIVAYQNEVEVGRYPLIAEQNVDRASLFCQYKKLLKSLV